VIGVRSRSRSRSLSRSSGSATEPTDDSTVPTGETAPWPRENTLPASLSPSLSKPESLTQLPALTRLAARGVSRSSSAAHTTTGSRASGECAHDRHAGPLTKATLLFLRSSSSRLPSLSLRSSAASRAICASCSMARAAESASWVLRQRTRVSASSSSSARADCSARASARAVERVR
jgi:hypothetical protein